MRAAANWPWQRELDMATERVTIAVIVRPAVAQDHEAIWRIRTRAIRSGCISHYAPSDVERWVSASMPGDFATVVETVPFHVAQHGDFLVGCGFLNVKQGEIGAMFTDPDAQRMGVATAILAELENIALREGVLTLRLDATLNAVPFYSRAGYHVDKASTYRHPDGFELPCVTMIKMLGQP